MAGESRLARLRRSARRLGPLDCRALVGSGCFWAWIDALFASVFFGLFGQAQAMAEPAAWLSSLLGVPLALAVLARPALARRLLADRRVLVGLGAVGTAGSLLFSGAAWLASWPLFAAGLVLAALFMASGVVSWGSVYCSGGTRTAVLYVAGGFAFAAVPHLLFFALIRPLPAVAFALMPLASMALLAALPAEGRAYEPAATAASRPGLVAGASGTSRVSRALGVSGGVVCALVLVMLGFGYMQHLVSFSGLSGFGGTDAGVTVQNVRSLSAALLLVVVLVAPRRAHLAFRAGLLVIVAGFSLMPFLYGGGLFWVSGTVMMAGYTVFDVLMWVVVAQVGYVRRGDALRAVCVLQLLVKGTCGALGALAAGMLRSLASGAVFACADAIFVGYLMTVAVTLLITSVGVWGLFGARRPADEGRRAGRTASDAAGPASALGPFDSPGPLGLSGSFSMPGVPGAPAVDAIAARVDALSAEHNLTDREREVFAYLAQGRTQPWVAEALGISESTVNFHVRHVYAKLGAGGRQELLDLVREG